MCVDGVPGVEYKQKYSGRPSVPFNFMNKKSRDQHFKIPITKQVINQEKFLFSFMKVRKVEREKN